MPVQLRWNEPYGVIATLSGEYAVEDVADAFEDAFPKGSAVGPLVILDLCESAQDHAPPEIEHLAEVLSQRTDTVWVRTADVLRYGLARELMGCCAGRGVTVRIEHEDPG